jgi:uncharacterized Zn-binding protein involved in type VI secretion
MMNGSVCVGDLTDHGGTVLDGIIGTDLNGRQMTGLGHLVACPKCQGVFPIVEGNESYAVNGTPVSLHDMKTACGASLIAGNQGAQVQI